ncbi:GCN5-related N-acetyltransferase [Candidatus Koribacter versatilis Ellin345]|uniref:GCN5-related N-acetyltransferase n=1 Tax=Koribacter versatilis (strain Ellin345) TaxID=204669 RepID=Q1IRZ0_KORVE|nr:GNAT family N-acetyltransferase [Candidatus Koribacter versatilis]ABF40360.1 GCN5-related N-acetyltransferase [Candidatus Koribacter versatilis Ellin345]
MPAQITLAESPLDIAHVAELFREYAAWLAFPLDFQNFDEELTTLPGKYASPTGRLLLARCDGLPAGCGAFRPLDPKVCEMKRVFVRPEFRGHQLGYAMIVRLISEAREAGYEFIRLDTIPGKMPDANRIYRTLGFYEIPPYYQGNPHADACYLEVRL